MFNAEKDTYYTYTEVAEGLGTGRSTIHEFVTKKGLPMIKLGKHPYIKGSDFIDWADSRKGEN